MPAAGGPQEVDASWVRKTVIFLASQTVSLFGSSVVGFSIIWHITLETSSGMMMTIGTLCNFLPQIFISLFAGVWADRYNRKLLIMMADGCVAVFTLILAVLYLSGHTDLWLVFFVLAMRSLFAGIQMPAVSAILPQIVPQQRLMRVNALNTTINSMMTLLSPAVGGAVLGTLGFGYSLLVDTTTAMIAIVIITFLRVPRLPARAEQTTPLADLKTGMRYIWGSSFLRNMIVFYAIAFFLITPASFLTPLLVERSFGAEVWRLTANEMVWSLGSVLGGIVVSLWGGFRNRIFSLGFSLVGFGVTFLLLGAVRSFWFYLLVMGLAGLFLPLFSSAEMTLLQEKVKQDMLGRVFSLTHLSVSIIMPVAMLLFGPLADLVSVELLLIVSGALLALLGVYIFSSKRLLAFDAKTEGE